MRNGYKEFSAEWWKCKKNLPDDKIFGDSPYAVYEWYKSNGECFYVGFGKNYRWSIVHPKNRSKAFMDVHSQGGCYYKILAGGMTERQGRDMEREQIEKRKSDGSPIVNVQFVDYGMYHTPAQEAFHKRLAELHREKGRVKRGDSNG